MIVMMIASNKYFGHLTYFMVIQVIFSKFVDDRGAHNYSVGWQLPHLSSILAPPLDMKCFVAQCYCCDHSLTLCFRWNVLESKLKLTLLFNSFRDIHVVKIGHSNFFKREGCSSQVSSKTNVSTLLEKN